jgi:hypothetical protein
MGIIQNNTFKVDENGNLVYANEPNREEKPIQTNNTKEPKENIKSSNTSNLSVFHYITLFNLLLTVILLVCVLWPSNTKSYSKKATNNIGKYIYVDRANVIHIKSGCKAVFKKQESQYVTPIPKDELTKKQLEKVCSQCINEKQLDSLRWYVEYTDEGHDLDKDTWD